MSRHPLPGRTRQFALAAAAVLSVVPASSALAKTTSAKGAGNPNWDIVAFEVKSWGQARSSWTIGRDGTGNWAEPVGTPSETGAPTHTAYHLIEAGSSGFARIAAILSNLPDPAPDSRDCEQFMPDMAYGTVRLTKGATTTEIAWNAGCMDERYRSFMATLQQADELMREWGKAGKIVRRE